MCHRVQVRASLGACPGVYLRTYSEVYLGVYSECTWECIVMQAGSALSGAIGSVLESMPRSVLENVLGVYFGAS